jgi:hypothetical protein
MKKLNKMFRINAIVIIYFFSAAICFGQSINNADELKKYLDSQPANSPDKPIKVTMNANDLMFMNIADVIKFAGKYVSLNISGNVLTTIPEFAFVDKDAQRGCKTLVSITIPNSVTDIGNYAFGGCINLTGIIIPNSVKSIGECAFVVCESLASVTIGNKVTSIGAGAFAGCESLKGIIIPNSVTSIGEQAFSDCTSLTDVIIGNGVTSIDSDGASYGIFHNCSNLTSVNIGKGVTSIGVNAFYNCANLTSVTFQGTISSSNFDKNAFHWVSFDNNVLRSWTTDLRTKYLAGGIGTYTRPNGDSETWTKK